MMYNFLDSFLSTNDPLLCTSTAANLYERRKVRSDLLILQVVSSFVMAEERMEYVCTFLSFFLV